MENKSRGRLAPLLNSESAAAKQLLTEGWAIVRVCSEERARKLAAGVYTDVESLGIGFKRDRPETWTTKNLPQHTHGLFQNQQFGLRKGVCEARLATKPIWEQEIFGGMQCISSFDAISFSTPDMQRREYDAEMRKNLEAGESVLLSSWIHTDQAKGKPDCALHIQGAFALTPLGPGEKKTQLVLPPEGTMLQEWSDAFLRAFPIVPAPKGKFDPERAEWVKHTAEEREWLIKNGRVVSPCLKMGEMLLWDSRVPHASLPGYSPDPRRTRISVFVSALPVELISAEDIALRRKMLEDGVTSGHRVTTLGKRKYLECKFANKGQTYGKQLPDYDTSRVVSGFAKAFEKKNNHAFFEEDDMRRVALGIAEFCGAYGWDAGSK